MMSLLIHRADYLQSPARHGCRRVIGTLLACLAVSSISDAEEWPQWRGETRDGPRHGVHAKERVFLHGAL